MISDAYITPVEGTVFVDGVGDSTQGLQDAIDIAASTGTTLFLRRGIYKVTAPLGIVTIEGIPFSLVSDFAVLVWGGALGDEAVLTVSTGTSADSFRLEGLVLDGNDLAKHGLRVDGGFNTPLCEVNQVISRRCRGAAMMLNGTGPGLFRNCGANLSQSGWWLLGCNRTQLHSCEARYFITLDGFIIDGSSTSSGFGPLLLSPHVEGIGGVGLWVGNTGLLEFGPTGVVIRDGYTEAVGGESAAISLDASVRACLIQGMRIVASGAPTSAIVYDPAATGTIEDTAISLMVGNPGWGDITPPVGAKMVVTGTLLAGS